MPTPVPLIILGVVAVAAIAISAFNIFREPTPPPRRTRVPTPVPLHSTIPEAEVEDNNRYPASLRVRARDAGKSAETNERDAKVARQQGQHSEANRLQLEAERNRNLKDQYNRIAAYLIYQKHNPRNKPGLIDLHELFVEEALERTEAAINRARQGGLNSLKIIVGKGNNSRNSVAKLKPAVEDWLRENGYKAQLHPKNNGMIVVSNLNA
ncbi:hypothetical protein FRC03_008850 [Tulasnella sp. 419]|nr:hypothetical protein FRC03_008850 [Tulasnella sp. 419]